MKNLRLRTDGKFFRAGGRRVVLRTVTYGPFPGGWPRDLAPDFRRIRAAGFDALRLYEMPDRGFLDAAAAHGLWVFGGLRWGYQQDFFRCPALLSSARVGLAAALNEAGAHPALAGVFVANEIPADLVRWMGPARVREAVEELIALGRRHAPRVLFAYANFPSTEYLEPANADFTAFNIYLEDAAALRRYVKRLHHVSGDRPLVVSEFGLDSRRNGLDRQAGLLREAMAVCQEEACAGFTVYAWSDRWWNNGAEVIDWDFGLTDRAGNDKPALAALSGLVPPELPDGPVFSVIVCTRNGADRIGACLDAVGRMEGRFETIVVDDGSADATAEFVKRSFPMVKLIELEPCGLSAARNAGAKVASGEVLAFTDDDCEPDREWLVRLAKILTAGDFAAAGGPNIPPPPREWHQAVVSAAPGAPGHVMLDDVEAEHLPGCNLAVRREAFEAVGGFDPLFQTAGDDVDFCWRLYDAGFRLAFAPDAFVWHHRRTQVRAYLRQQYGYGQAERLLMAKHPHRFTRGGSAKWTGCIYDGAPVRVCEGDVIYHGPMGTGAYQSIIHETARMRALRGEHDHGLARLTLVVAGLLAHHLRAWARARKVFELRRSRKHTPREHFTEWELPGRWREGLLDQLLADVWRSCGVTSAWDVEKDGVHLLLATERGEGGSANTLVRMRGSGAELPRCIRPDSDK
ncbi:MAG: glycosyltransferase [Luteolibacter sp.]